LLKRDEREVVKGGYDKKEEGMKKDKRRH